MPLYDYECCKCGHGEEVQRAIADPHPPCPKCDAPGGDEGFAVQIVPIRFSVAEPNGRPIFSEAQIESSHGRDWRTKGTTGNPGGIGRRTFFHR